MDQIIHAYELQRLLREFQGPLADVTVTEKHPVLMPHIVEIKGVCQLHGNPFVFEVEDFDLRAVKNNDDVIALAGQILKSFEQASQDSRSKPVMH